MRVHEDAKVKVVARDPGGTWTEFEFLEDTYSSKGREHVLIPKGHVAFVWHGPGLLASREDLVGS